MARKKYTKLTIRDIAHVGPKTPAGEWFRKYWLVVSRAVDLKNIPQRLRILGEDLVLFRDGSDRIGLLGAHCCHRGTSLEYGDIEVRGIRCPYHGWLYDVQGNCLEQPAEPLDSSFYKKVRQPWYPVKELGGLLFAYMGANKNEPPPLPHYSSLVRQDGHRAVEPPRIWDYNWFNFFENVPDLLHGYILHTESRKGRPWENAFWRFGGHPEVHAIETDYGMKVALHWPGPKPDSEYLQLNSLALPSVAALGGRDIEEQEYERTLFITPVDDDHFMVFNSDFSPQFDDSFLETRQKQRLTPPKPQNDDDNRKYMPFRGQVWKEDYVCQVTQGSIGYRNEALGASDKGVILLRKIVLKAIETVQTGGTPKGILSPAKADKMFKLPAGRSLVSKSTISEILAC